MRSYSVKENPIGSAVRRDPLVQPHSYTDILLLYYNNCLIPLDPWNILNKLFLSVFRTWHDFHVQLFLKFTSRAKNPPPPPPIFEMMTGKKFPLTQSHAVIRNI